MDILSDWQDWETDFRGETVKMKLLDMDTADYLKVMSNMGDTGGGASFEAGIKILGTVLEVKEIFPKYVKDIENLTMNGQPVSADMLCEKNQLSNLAMSILTRLIYISTAEKGEEKNSEELSDAPTLKEVSKA